MLFTMPRISAFSMHAFVLNAEIIGDHGILVRDAILLHFKITLESYFGWQTQTSRLTKK